jgi:hypothetical protein
LVQVDRNGNSTTSGIATVNWEKSSDFDFTVYPNPVDHGNPTLNITGKKDEQVEISVIDVTGKNLYTQKILVGNENNEKLTLNLNLSDGIYFIRLQDNDQNVQIKKLIVAKN